jgi:hypothetical protein
MTNDEMREWDDEITRGLNMVKSVIDAGPWPIAPFRCSTYPIQPI